MIPNSKDFLVLALYKIINRNIEIQRGIVESENDKLEYFKSCLLTEVFSHINRDKAITDILT